MCKSYNNRGGGSTARLGGRELTLLCGFNQNTLLQNRDNSGLLGTPLYCSPKLGGQCPPNAQVGGAAAPPAPPVEPPLNKSITALLWVGQYGGIFSSRLLYCPSLRSGQYCQPRTEYSPVLPSQSCSNIYVALPISGYLLNVTANGCCQ